MLAQTMAITLATLTFASAAHADFLITTQSQKPMAASESDLPEVPNQPALGRHSLAHTIVRMSFPVAQGFGNQVPLRFAVLQIVPKAIPVSYGASVNPDDTVDWTGGQGWNRVLARAVAPLHIRLVLTPRGLIIAKIASPIRSTLAQTARQTRG